jgi:hypothetical protein
LRLKKRQRGKELQLKRRPRDKESRLSTTLKKSA